MSFAEVIIMAIVQGVSEFLPISSSAHLVFTANIYKFITGSELNYNSQEIFLDIILHFGTLVAVILFYRKELIKIVKAIFCAVKENDYHSAESKLGLYLVLGTFVTIVVAYPLSNIAEILVFSPFTVGVLLTFTGFLLIFSEYISNNILEQKNHIDLKTSIMIAISQGLAALPGFSRSGLTISTGLIMGLNRSTAAKYSFLLSIPIILGASVLYPVIKLDMSEIAFNWTKFILGAFISGLTGYFCIKYFIRFISNFSLKIFGVYCLVVGILMTLLFYFIK